MYKSIALKANVGRNRKTYQRNEPVIMKEDWLWEVYQGLLSFSDLCFYRLSIKYICIGHNDNIQIPVLLDVCNILSHKSARNPEQILKSAQYLMRKIETVDINHFTNITN